MTDPHATSNLSTLVRSFTDTFETRDTGKLSHYLHPDITFRNYGDPEVHGRDAVLEVWARVFANFAVVRFETIHQAQTGPVVLAEQIHHLGLPGGPVAPIMNLAVYEIEGGLITAWRDYTNPEVARQLLRGEPGPT
jgi:limonene-1,2-epoxide hydrolase